ncbi:MAG: glutamate 5-kinase, partial [Mediterranea sp.]|nr:glutamate 5-kinase [Mediterranea sp.]
TSVIREIEHGKDLSAYIQASKSSFGRGGMLTKTTIASKVADEGITVFIANGRRDGILTSLLYHPSDTLCTRFIASPTPVSSVKKWIAHSEGFAKGELHIDRSATELLNADKAVSILPVGITRVEGEFEKDDIVRIIDYQGHRVGVGRVNCDSAQARDAMGKHGKRAVVHYDYLYIE